HRFVRKNARRSSIAIAWRPISMSGLSAAYGRCNGFSIQPTELTVSQTPTKYGLHTRWENVALNSLARRKKEFRSGLWGLPPTLLIAVSIRMAYGTSGSLLFGMSPYMWSSDATERTV